MAFKILNNFLHCFVPRYTKYFYCIDHVMDYCEACDCDEGCKDKLSHPKALIRDPEIGLRGYEKEFNIFGSHSESMTSKIIKIVGYPISAFFLVFSLVVINRCDPNKYWVRLWSLYTFKSRYLYVTTAFVLESTFKRAKVSSNCLHSRLTNPFRYLL